MRQEIDMTKDMIGMKSFESFVETTTIEEFKEKIYTLAGKKIDEKNGRVENFDFRNLGKFHEDTVENYLKELSVVKQLKEEEILELLKEIRGGDASARETLIEGLLKLVAKIALNYAKVGASFIDLVQEGLMGIITAVENYDLNFEMKFIEYTEFWIKYQMVQSNKGAVEELKSPVIAYFKHLKVEMFKYNNKGDIDSLDVEEVLNMDMEEFENLEKINEYGFLIKDEDRQEMESYSSIAEIDLELDKIERLMSVSNLANKFTTREIEILSLYYGLDGKRKYFEDIGKTFEIEPENVKRMIDKLMIKLKYNGKREWINEN